jgi:hypothetical protein
MLGQGEPILKAFILCDEVRQHPSDPQMDIVGAGLSVIRSQSDPPFPCQQTFWVYVLLSDEKPQGHVKLVIRRADSGIQYSFREIDINYADPLKPSQLAIRVFNFEFPEPGIYFIELWYDGEWLLDHRLELMG